MRAALVMFLFAAACEAPIPEPMTQDVPTTPPPDAELLAARPYTLQVPAQFDPLETWPLLLVLHGYGGSGAATIGNLNLSVIVRNKGVFIVTPDGMRDRLNQRAWHPEASRWPHWDQAWLSAIIHDVKTKYPIDPKRVFVIGHSQGAHMAHRMACDASADVTAIVSVAGQVSKIPKECEPTHLVSVLQVHGTADSAIGYTVPPSPRIPSAHDTVAVWARNNGCTGQLTPSAASPVDLTDLEAGRETDLEYYGGCPTGIDVALWSMREVGHQPNPNAKFPLLIYEFLDSHPRQ